MSENPTVKRCKISSISSDKRRSKEVLFPRRFELIDSSELSMCLKRTAMPFAMR